MSPRAMAAVIVPPVPDSPDAEVGFGQASASGAKGRGECLAPQREVDGEEEMTRIRPRPGAETPRSPKTPRVGVKHGE